MSSTEDAAVEPRRGLPTESKLFGSLGLFYLLLAVIYAIAAYEWAGVALLGFGAAFSFIAATYFAIDLRDVQDDVELLEGELPTEPPTHAGLYLPHTSVWPIGIGIGTALTLAGDRHRLVGVAARRGAVGALADRLRHPIPRPQLVH